MLNVFGIITKYKQWWVCLLCLIPLLLLINQALNQQLDPADPARSVVLYLGEWSLRLLLLCLSVRPLCHLFANNTFIALRRTLGLWSLFYVTLHGLAWFVFLLDAAYNEIVIEIIDNPYIVVGATAALLLIFLGASSSRAAKIRLGKNWQRLHYLVYPAAILACVHFFWLSKTWFEPLIYSTVLTVLFVWRIIILKKS